MKNILCGFYVGMSMCAYICIYICLYFFMKNIFLMYCPSKLNEQAYFQNRET